MNKHQYLWHLVGFFFSYVNDARSHDPKKEINLMYPGRINVKFGGGIVWDIVVGSICSLIGKPLNHIVIFWKVIYRDCFKMRLKLRCRCCSFITRSTMKTIHCSGSKRPETRRVVWTWRAISWPLCRLI